MILNLSAIFYSDNLMKWILCLLLSHIYKKHFLLSTKKLNTNKTEESRRKQSSKDFDQKKAVRAHLYYYFMQQTKTKTTKASTDKG